MPVMTSLAMKPVTSTIGSVIDGVDLTGPLPGEDVAAIRQALLDRGVVFFRGQELSSEQMHAFVSNFGDPIHIDYFGDPADGTQQAVAAADEIITGSLTATRRGTAVWHTDIAWIPKPPFATVLRAASVPPVGGDTCWADMAAAYEALSDPMKRMLDGLTAVNSMLPTIEREQLLKQALMVKGQPKVVETVHPVETERGRRAETQGQLPTLLVRLDHDDVREPAPAKPDDRHRADRAATEDADLHAGLGAGDVDSVQRDRERLDQRPVGEVDVVGDAPEHLGGAAHPLGVTTAVGAEADAAIERGSDVEAIDWWEGIDADAVALAPALHSRSDRGDRAGELVTEDRALGQDPGREHVEVGAADPAGRDLDGHLALAGLGVGDLADLEALLRRDRDSPHAAISGIRSGQAVSASTWAESDSRRSSRSGGATTVIPTGSDPAGTGAGIDAAGCPVWFQTGV